MKDNNQTKLETALQEEMDRELSIEYERSIIEFVLEIVGPFSNYEKIANETLKIAKSQNIQHAYSGQNQELLKGIIEEVLNPRQQKENINPKNKIEMENSTKEIVNEQYIRGNIANVRELEKGGAVVTVMNNKTDKDGNDLKPDVVNVMVKGKVYEKFQMQSIAKGDYIEAKGEGGFSSYTDKEGTAHENNTIYAYKIVKHLLKKDVTPKFMQGQKYGNSIAFSGRLVSDIETFSGSTPEGKDYSFGKVTIANTIEFMDRDNILQERTHFINMTLAEDQLKSALDHKLSKGEKVQVRGAVLSNNYQKENGKMKYGVKVVGSMQPTKLMTQTQETTTTKEPAVKGKKKRVTD